MTKDNWDTSSQIATVFAYFFDLDKRARLAGSIPWPCELVVNKV